MDKSIYSLLNEYAKREPLRMHMPGHKGKNKEFLNIDAQLDITEITGFDNLHCAEGILKNSMQLASKLWHSKKSYYLVNGSTCGIMAAIRTMTKRGDKVLVSRNCHKAVFNAIEICGLVPVFIMPQIIEEWGLFGSVSPKDIEEMIEKESDIRLVILTSPTYEGVISDIAEISKIVHKKNIPLFVDEAHGAHLEIFEQGSGACSLGADICVQSLHKTLSSFTQTAVLHIQGNLIDDVRLQHQLSVFETSSPSYLLMASIDGCIREMINNPTCVNEWKDAIKTFYEEVKPLKNIKIFGNENITFKYDKSKIVIGVRNNLSVQRMVSELSVANVEFEMQSEKFVLAMTGMGDTQNELYELAQILKEIDKKLCEDVSIEQNDSFLYDCPACVMGAEKALEEEFEMIPVKEAEGRICAEYVWAYPPGIPILIPGEKISMGFIQKISSLTQGERIKSDRGELPDKIAVLYNIKKKRAASPMSRPN